MIKRQTSKWQIGWNRQTCVACMTLLGRINASWPFDYHWSCHICVGQHGWWWWWDDGNNCSTSLCQCDWNGGQRAITDEEGCRHTLNFECGRSEDRRKCANRACWHYPDSHLCHKWRMKHGQQQKVNGRDALAEILASENSKCSIRHVQVIGTQTISSFNQWDIINSLSVINVVNNQAIDLIPYYLNWIYVQINNHSF